MPNFTLRIELLGTPSQEIYKDLHARMERGGFLQTVTGTQTVALPHATYYGFSTATVEQVRDWARDHAKAAWGQSVVFVAQTETWAWGKS